MRFPLRLIPPSLALLVIAPAALAQPSADNQARALVLFKEAVVALEQGDYSSACPKLEAAMRMFPSPGTGLNIARCLEHEGKVLAAWAAYQRVLVLNRETAQVQRREAIEKMATDAAAALHARLPKLRVTAPSAPAGLVVTQDGEELPVLSMGVALPAEPGPHAIVATAPGRRPWKQTVTAVEGKTTDVTIALTDPLPASATPPPGPLVSAPRPSPPSPGVTPTARDAKGRIPAWAWITGGGGVVLGVVAAVFRADQASLDAKQVAAGCGVNVDRCPRSYTTLVDDNAAKARDRGLFFGLGAVGIAGLGAGVFGIVFSSMNKGERPTTPVEATVLVAPGMRGAALVGKF